MTGRNSIDLKTLYINMIRQYECPSWDRGSFVMSRLFILCCFYLQYGAFLLLIFLMEAISGVLAHMYESTVSINVPTFLLHVFTL